MKIILYSTNCPRCQVLESKLDEKNIDYEVHSDVKEMIALGFRSAPILEVDGERMDFSKGLRWIGQQ